jgi:hypothetical protein
VRLALHPRVFAPLSIALSLLVQRNMLMIDAGEGLFKAAAAFGLIRGWRSAPENKQ